MSYQLQATVQCNVFHLFPKLPIELRLKIWTFAFPAPQAHELSCFGGAWYCTPGTTAGPNYAFRANKEAHVFFLEKWSRLELHPVWSMASKGPAVVHFNPKFDTMYIGASRGFSRSTDSDRLEALNINGISHSIRFLAYEVSQWYTELSNPPEGESSEEYEYSYTLKLFSYFSSLELFIIVPNDIVPAWPTSTRVPAGEIRFLNPVQLDLDSEELAPMMLKTLHRISSSQGAVRIPTIIVQDIFRRGVRVNGG
jgi:hypothetical protein